MNCGELRQKVYLFYYGEITEAELRDIYDHLGECSHCKEEKELIAQILKKLENGFVDEPAPETIKEKLFGKLRL